MNKLRQIYEKLYRIKAIYFDIDSDKSLLSDRAFVKKYYLNRMGTPIDFKNPKLFSEKLNWLKVYYHDPLMTICADKYRMREYVRHVIGEEYAVPILKKWDRAEDIDFDVLPEQFVLKCNHDGGPFVCFDKRKVDNENIIWAFREKIRKDYYARGREWSYKNIRRCVFAEPLLSTGELLGYKFFCFNGEPRFFTVESEHTSAKSCSVSYWNLDFTPAHFHGHNPSPKVLPERPEKLAEMIEVARKLASYGKFPFVRVDMYVVNNQILIGELTFFHANGIINWEPKESNEVVGSYLKLPKKNAWRQFKDRDKKWIKNTLKMP